MEAGPCRENQGKDPLVGREFLLHVKTQALAFFTICFYRFLLLLLLLLRHEEVFYIGTKSKKIQLARSQHVWNLQASSPRLPDCRPYELAASS